MAWITSAIALIVGSIGMLNTMIVSVLERTQEIGILRAIGWRKSRIMKMILVESFTLSFSGAVFGILLAFVLLRALAGFPAGPRVCARRNHDASCRNGVSIVCFGGTGWRRIPGTARRQFAPYRGFAI